MASSQDTEITLGTGKLLVLFFGLVVLCALFFAMGYSLGRKSEPAVAAASAGITPATSSNSSKVKGGGSAAAPAMTFYKSVEQKSASPDMSPSSDTKVETPVEAANQAAQAPASNAVDPSTTIPSGGYFVQVAAVSKQEDADSLVDALKKKDYGAFVAPVSANDKLFRVQLGPFAEIKDAEATRAKLVGDGYSPIVKK